jgi:flagella basal body P-ring formation protein FlgA
MNRHSLRPLWIACLLLVLGPGAAHAQEPGEPLARIEAAAIAAVRAQLPATATITAGALDTRLRLPPCAGKPRAAAPSLRGANATVAVRCDAPAAWTVHVPLRISDLRPVLMLNRAIQRGDLVEAQMFVTQTFDVAQLPLGYVSDLAAIAGQQFRRPLAAGAVPTPADLEPPRWIRRGERVQLLGRAGNLEVRADGKALADGAAGGRVRVENHRSKRIVEGTVTAPGVVEVRL